jgi:hypothetical protein
MPIAMALPDVWELHPYQPNGTAVCAGLSGNRKFASGMQAQSTACRKFLKDSMQQVLCESKLCMIVSQCHYSVFASLAGCQPTDRL